jgi:hypothetical protein
MGLSPASLQKVITKHQPWQMMHMKQGLYFSTDTPKEQTTLNPTFPKGRLLGANECCGVEGWEGGRGGRRSLQRGRFCERWSLWFLASLSCLPSKDQHLSNEGATSSEFKNTAFYPHPLSISFGRSHNKQRLFLSQLGHTTHGTTTIRHTGHVTTRYMIYQPTVCVFK